MIDTSDAVSQNHMRQISSLILADLEGYNIGQNKVRVSFVSYGDSSKVLLPLTSGNDKVNIISKLSYLQKRGGLADITEALRLVNSDVLPNARPNVPVTIVLFMASPVDSTVEKLVIDEANRIKQKDVRIIVVGFSKDVFSQLIMGITNVPNGNVFPANGGEIADILGILNLAIVSASGKIAFQIFAFSCEENMYLEPLLC